jgi:hypothetical protein
MEERHMGTRSIRLVVTGGLMLAMFVLLARPAAAHEGRHVGDLEMVVGFGEEPAFAGQPNSVELLLFHHGGEPIIDLGDTLSVTVGFGDQSTDLSVEPFFEIGEFGTPGDYRAWFIPTRAGQYSFHFVGTIQGTKIDETFTSGPKTFDDVVNPADSEFPVKDPTNGELAERIDREIPRLESSIADVKTSGDQSVASAADDASGARTIAIVGVVLGALGVIAAIAAITMVRRTSA